MFANCFFKCFAGSTDVLARSILRPNKTQTTSMGHGMKRLLALIALIVLFTACHLGSHWYRW